MKMNFRRMAVAGSAFVCAMLFSLSWSEQGGLSFSTKAEAASRVYIYGANPYYAGTGLSWYAVRAYYFGGPWSGPGFSYTGWSDYAARNGIGCTPGTVIKGGDGILYYCQ